MYDRAYARQHQYDVTCHHLLCVAVRYLAQYRAQGYHSFMYSETYNHRFTVYYVAHKKLNQPTRSERGANLGRTAC